jgi:hypothetical protein
MSLCFGMEVMKMTQRKMTILLISRIHAHTHARAHARHEEFCIIGYNAMKPVKNQLTIQRSMSLPSSGSKSKPSKKPAGRAHFSSILEPFLPHSCLHRSNETNVLTAYFVCIDTCLQWLLPAGLAWILWNRVSSSCHFVLCVLLDYPSIPPKYGLILSCSLKKLANLVKKKSLRNFPCNVSLAEKYGVNVTSWSCAITI